LKTIFPHSWFHLSYIFTKIFTFEKILVFEKLQIKKLNILWKVVLMYRLDDKLFKSVFRILTALLYIDQCVGISKQKTSELKKFCFVRKLQLLTGEKINAFNPLKMYNLFGLVTVNHVTKRLVLFRHGCRLVSCRASSLFSS